MAKARLVKPDQVALAGVEDPEVKDRNVLILGLGVIGGGVAVARYFARHGARLRITDLRTREQLAPALAELSDLDAEFVLGEHRPEDIAWADLIVRNPGVPPSSPWLRQARDLGKPIEMELGFFVRRCPARVSAVTGTKGKTTTTSLLHQLLESDGRRVHLAGNMGVPAIALLDELSPADQVLLEISAQQLEALAGEGWPPWLALITNVEDDHIERYGSLEAYRAVKASLALGQAADGWTVLPAWDRDLAELCAVIPSKKVFIRDPARPFSVEGLGYEAVVEAGAGKLRWLGRDGGIELCDLTGFGLPGRHNQINLAFAAAGAYVSGRTPEEIATALPMLRGVAHRLENVGEWNGLTFVNDTAATAPIAVASALEALSGERLVLICGGTAKGSDLTPMVDAIGQAQADLVFLPGTGTDQLTEALAARAYGRTVAYASGMTEAVTAAARLAAEKGASCVALSPGCASFGLFANEFDRGDQFVAAVRALWADNLDAGLRAGRAHWRA